MNYSPRTLLVISAAVISVPFAASAQNGTWINLSGGDWTTAANWTNSIVAGGTNNTANFNTLDITADTTVTLDAPVTIGNLIFGDSNTNSAAGWILGNGGNTNNALTLAGSSPTVTVNALGTGKSVVFDAQVLGTNGFVKSGTGRLVLNNSSNSYTGSISNSFMSITNFGSPAPLYSTVVQQGRLVLGSGTAAGTGNILVITNPALSAPLTAFLDLNGHTVANNIGLAGDTYLYNGNTNNAATVNGDLWVRQFSRIGSSGLDAPGTVIVNGKVVFSAAGVELFTGVGGSLTVLNGTVNHANSNGIITVQSGTLRAQDGVNIATNSTLRIGAVSGNAGGIFESSADITRSIGNGAGLISVGTGGTTSTNIGFSAFGGPITVALGGTSSPTALTWGQANFLAGSSTLVLNAATADSTLTFANAIDLNGTNRTITVNAATAIVNGGLVNGALTKDGAGTLVLAGSNSLTGDTTITGGTLRTTLASFAGNVTLTNNGTFLLDEATDSEFSGTISGAGSFHKAGAGTLTLAAVNSYTRNTTVSGGTLRLANSNSLGATTNTVTVADGATLDLNGVTNAGRFVTISGTGVDGNGAVVNNGAAQASGLRLVLAANASIGGTARMDILGGATLVNGGTNTLTKTGTNVVAINPGTVVVGQINIDQGMLTSVNNAGSLGDTAFGTVVASNATLTFFNNTANALTNNENITLADGAFLAATTATSRNVLGGVITLSGGTAAVRVETNGTGTLQINNGFTGSGALNKTSGGTLELRGTNTHTGNTTITDGAVALTENARLAFTIGGDGTNNRVNGTGTLNADGIFAFDLSGASTSGGDSWLIVGTNVIANYGQNFRVDGFNGAGGNWTNTVNGATYVFAQSTGVLTVQSGGTNAYDAWTSYWQGLYPGFTDTEPAADPDGDSFDNDTEFAFDGNPMVGSPALLRARKAGANAVFDWVGRNTGVTYTVLGTTNLSTGPWTNAAVAVTDSADQSGILLTNDYTRREFTVPADNRSFYKVEAALP